MPMPMPTLARDDYDGSIHAQVDRAPGGPRRRRPARPQGGGRWSQGRRGALRAAELQHGAGRLLARRLEPRRPHELRGPTAPAQPGDSLAKPAKGPAAGGGGHD